MKIRWLVECCISNTSDAGDRRGARHLLMRVLLPRNSDIVRNACPVKTRRARLIAANRPDPAPGWVNDG